MAPSNQSYISNGSGGNTFCSVHQVLLVMLLLHQGNTDVEVHIYLSI